MLLKAAAEGQTVRVNRLLRLGVNVDFCDEDGMTALHHAVLSGFEDTVQTLLDVGRAVNAERGKYGTQLC